MGRAELIVSVAWDEAHTLGARLQSGKLVELCGVVFACVLAQPVAAKAKAIRPSVAVTAIAMEQEVARLAAPNAERSPLWPGFDPLAVPLAVCAVGALHSLR